MSVERIQIVAYPSPGGGRQYRLDQIAKYINLKEDNSVMVISPTKMHDAALAESDVIVLQGTVDPKKISMAWAYASEQGKLLVAELDDYIDVPKEHFLYTEHQKLDASTWTRGLLKVADIVTVTTEHLAEFVGEYNENVYVLKNCLDMDLWNQSPLKNEGDEIRVGWHGSATHREDLRMVRSAIFELLEKYPKMKFVYAGDGWLWKTKFFKEHPRTEYVEPVPVDEWSARLRSLRLDISLVPLINNEFNRCKCIEGESRVPTEKGILKIKDFGKEKPKSVYLGNRKYKILDWLSSSRKEKIRVVTNGGFMLGGSPEHKMLVGKKFKLFKNLQRGDVVQVSPITFPQKGFAKYKYPLWFTRASKHLDFMVQKSGELMPVITINPRWGRLIGYLLGDGYISRSNRFSISCSSDYPDIVGDVLKFADELGVNAAKSPKIIVRNGKKVTGGGIDILFHSASLTKFLREVIGFKARRKSKIYRVPEVIWKSPKSVVREFLRGLFESDGTVPKNNPLITYCTKSKDLAREVLLLLTGFGIKAKIYSRYNSSYRKHYYYIRLNRAQVDIFRQEIGFISDKKRQRVAEIVKKKHSNAYVSQTWEEEIVSVQKIKHGNILYDLEVDKKHQYSASGFIVHNSNLKWLENSICGIPSVLSPVVYQKTVKDGETGLIAETPKDFVKLTSKLIEDEKVRKKIGENAYKEVRKNYDIADHYKKWLNLYVKEYRKKHKKFI